MKSLLFALAGSAILAAGCASQEEHMQRLGDRLHTAPLITVRLGLVSVAPEPIVLDLRGPKAAITWQAPAGYTFRDKGIEILGLVVDADGKPVSPEPNELKKPSLRTQPEAAKGAFDCKVGEKEVTCAAVAGVVRRGGVYRYAIRLKDAGQKPVDGDPYIIPM